MIVVGPLQIDESCSRASVLGADVRLRPLDLRVLAQLAAVPGRVVSRQTIAEALWGPDSTVDVRSVDTSVTRIRRALEASDCIVTVRRVGYRLDVERLVEARR